MGYAVAGVQHDRAPHLGLRVALLSGALVPGQRLCLVPDGLPAVIQHAAPVHGADMVLQRGLLKAGQGAHLVYRYAVAFIVHHAAVKERIRVALLGGLLEPLQGGGPVGVGALSLVVHQSTAVLSGSAAHLCRLLIGGQRFGVSLGRICALRGAEGALERVDPFLHVF